MESLIQKLSKKNRKAALLYKNDILLRYKRGQVNFESSFYGPDDSGVESVENLIDSFDWSLSSQGYEYWARVLWSVA